MFIVVINICGEVSAHIYGEEQSFYKLLNN